MRKEYGVSPVIATILMVAITVVLAATVYIMASGITANSQTQIAGNLVYRSNLSNRTAGNATFEIVLYTPSMAKIADIHIKLLNTSGNLITGFNHVWRHLASNSTSYIKTGDLLEISVPNTDITGYQVVISISGYGGTITGTVPPS